MNRSPAVGYDPRTASHLCVADALRLFGEGSDSSRSRLENCLETIEANEPPMRAFVLANAGILDAHYTGDGLLIGVKDLFETADLPTPVNSPIYEGGTAPRDAMHVQAQVLGRGGELLVGETS